MKVSYPPEILDLFGEIRQIQVLSEGKSIQVQKIDSATGSWVYKYRDADGQPDLFLAEKQGLEAIANTGTIKTPRVWNCDTSCLLLEYIDHKNSFNDRDFVTLAEGLAALHRISSNYYGWGNQNYIGNLTQTNTPSENWLDFYLKDRIRPQLEMAIRNGHLQKMEIPGEIKMREVLNRHLRMSPPSLLHGDLWSGNFLIRQDGTSFLIDPAVYFGSHKMDIAMTLLFGGFPSVFYESYYHFSKNPVITDEEKDLYQLYYLLIHLNLFGKTYYPSVRGIFERYFN